MPSFWRPRVKVSGLPLTIEARSALFLAFRRSSGLRALKPSTIGELMRASSRGVTDALRQVGPLARQVEKKGARQSLRRSAKPPGKFVSVDGMRVHYIAKGKGRPIILLHGNGTMAEDFVVCGLLDQLARHYRVIAIDRPGFGQTRRPRHCVWTPAAQAYLIEGVLARLNVVRPLVLGHSWGTLVALALAGRGSLGLRGLVLLSGYYYRERRVDLALAAPLALPGFGDAVRSMLPRPLRLLAAEQGFQHVFRPQPVPARFKAHFPVETALGEEQLRASAEDTALLNAASARLGLSYQALRLPVAILAGDADAVVDTSGQSSRLHTDLPNSTLKLLPGQGHMIHYSAKRHICRAIDGIMNGSRPASRQP